MENYWKSLSRILVLFLIGSLAGSFLDVLYSSLTTGHFVWSGIIFYYSGWYIPIFPIYGFGLLFISMIHSKVEQMSYYYKFLVYAICLGIYELIGGIFSLLVFSIRLWDYSHNFMNIYGHVDLVHIILWGILGLVTDYVLTKYKK